ncbi:hypothetical protein ACIBI4_26950 [Streptomyces sp. NPDC050418]|uniref:SCO2400 family protein n=1 Tax=Streptomyces sp. NPDC050418 TaxID=3365612 RepID=UPI003798CEA0
MDFCHPCHRHLNGALTCPGCGTPADAVRRYAAARVAEDGAATGPDDTPATGVVRSHRGRRAQRSRAAQRAHRRKRHKVLLITAGLALAAGALSLTELGTEHPAGPTAAPAPSDPATTAEPTSAPAPTTASARPSREAPEPTSRTSSSSSSAAPRVTPDGAGESSAPPRPEGQAPAERPPTTKPKPKPKPTAPGECDRFLFWCV